MRPGVVERQPSTPAKQGRREVAIPGTKIRFVSLIWETGQCETPGGTAVASVRYS
jgi:hypothetical protein